MAVISRVKEDTSARILFIQGLIDDETVENICPTILHLNYIDEQREKSVKDYTRPPIHIHINSLGGSVHEMWAIINSICSSKTPVYTYCTGIARSAAAKILMAGHKRFIYKYAEVMIHQITLGGSRMTSQEWGVKSNLMDRWQNRVNTYIMDRTAITKETLDDMMAGNKDLYYNAEDALEYKIVDEII